MQGATDVPVKHWIEVLDAAVVAMIGWQRALTSSDLA
jgi:hypothetical protein